MFINVVLYILVLLLVGLGAKKAGILTSDRVNILNKLAFYVALPSLIFHSLYSEALRDIFSPGLAFGFCVTIPVILAIGWLAFSRIDDRAKKSVMIVQSYHGNIGYMGLPVVFLTLGQAAASKASLLLGIGSMIQISLTMSVLVYLNSASSKILREVKRIPLNPIILSLIAGLLFSYFSISLPSIFDTVLSWIGEAALPIAMLGVGATLKLKGLSEKVSVFGSVVVLKMVAMPLLGWLFLTLLNVDPLGTKTAVLFLAMPTAISTFIYSKELGGDEETASINISITTLVSLLSISMILFIF